MIFDKLYTWRQWQYLPMINRLLVFDKTGYRIAEWYMNNKEIHSLNILPIFDVNDFALIVGMWGCQVRTLLEAGRCASSLPTNSETF